MDNSNIGKLRDSVVEMIKNRDALEDEIQNLTDELTEQNVTMTEPLVDDEGYPRSDIDIASIRQIRQDIIRKQNDFRNLTDKIGEDLAALHAAAKVAPSASCLNVQEIFLKPFARVDLVNANSPAENAGLKVGDLLVKFGSLKFRDFKNSPDLLPVLNLVKANLKKQIHVNVLRNEEVVHLILIPDVWAGKGYLGCVIKPLLK